jgi:hypothetical protein
MRRLLAASGWLAWFVRACSPAAPDPFRSGDELSQPGYGLFASARVEHPLSWR